MIGCLCSTSEQISERRRQSDPSRFKADFYRTSNAILFIESEHEQATRIAAGAGKPVLCTGTQEIVLPTSPNQALGEMEIAGHCRLGRIQMSIAS